MSEKTLGEVKRYLVCSYGDMMEHADGRWCLFEKAQAAADAIAAPLLARIAELEGEVNLVWQLLSEEQHESDRLRKRLAPAWEEIQSLQSKLCVSAKAEEAAHQRGVAEERERCAKVVEDEGFGHCSCVDRERCASCGTVDDILERINAKEST